jgi:TRAP transporter TAXI family solute receptor
MLGEYKFFAKDTVPAGTYQGVGETPTISVNAQWVTSAKQPEDLVYKITKAVWNADSRKLLDAGHAKGKLITLQNATSGLGIPLHPGAEKFYREAGVLK